jgi:hypothetical protein
MNNILTQSYNLACNVGDCIEFKKFTPSCNTETFEYITCKGQVVDNTNPELLEVNMYNENEKDFTGGACWVNPGSIDRHYPQDKISRLSTRLILKDIWKDLIFREVKTVKTRDQNSTIYKYLNDNGFVRTEKYHVFEDVYRKVPPNKYPNIYSEFDDYFGFTTHRSIRNNDIYCNQEIFFSRKCYGELNLNGRHISGDFS